MRLSALILTLLLWSSASMAQNICDQAANNADRAVREQYQQTLDFALRVAAAAAAKGFNPRSFPQADQYGNVAPVDLVAIAEAIARRRDEAIGQIYQAHQQCQAGFAPYQRFTDIATWYMTGGLAGIIPERARFIDVSNLMAGTPFGGQGALIPATREWIFNRLGIGGPVADFIRNPLQVTPTGLVRLPWNPILPTPGLPGVQLPNFSVPNLPSLPSPPPVQIGKVQGYRVCVPWC